MSDNNTTNKVSFDPGWNDPPKLAYNTQQVPHKPRNMLNKRIAFPLSGTTGSPVFTIPLNLPPMPAGHSPALPVHSNPRTILNEDNVNIDSEKALIEVKDILLKSLEESSELGSKANDIKRRISLMEEMWSNGKLNSRIQAQMQELVCALKDDQPSKADDIHRALMVDHVSLVGSWMPGIKQLIYHCIARSELLAIDKE